LRIQAGLDARTDIGAIKLTEKDRAKLAAERDAFQG
jgi:hypothetical protein